MLVGDITDAAEIAKGDLIAISTKKETFTLRIASVEMVDKIGQGIAHIGLLISKEDQKALEGLDLNGLEIRTFTS